MKAYKTEIYPTKEQKQLIHQTIGNTRFVYNRLFLQNQCEKLGIELRLINRFYPSSKRCSACGCKNNNLKLKDRHWTCENCHTYHDRDVNAAINIENCHDYTVLTTV